MKNNYGNTIPISGSKIAKFSEKADIEILFLTSPETDIRMARALLIRIMPCLIAKICNPKRKKLFERR